MVNNALFYTAPEQAVFAVSLKVKTGSDWAAGVFKLKGNTAISASLTGKEVGWARDIGVDIVDLQDKKVILFVAVAPETAVAPTKFEEFFSVPGRAIAVCSQQNGHAQAKPGMTKALSYKVKGAALEEAPLACVVVGLKLSETVATDKTFHLGFRCSLTAAEPGLVTSEGQATEV